MIDVASFLLSCEKPQTWHEPLYVPILMSVVGLTIYGLGVLSETREMKPKPWKWAGLFFFLVALYSGGTLAWCMTDNFYRSLVSEYGKKMMLGHIGAFAIPLLSLIGVGIHHWISSRDPYRHQ